MKSTFPPPWTDIARPASRQEFHSRGRPSVHAARPKAMERYVLFFVGTTLVRLFYERKVVENMTMR